MAQKLYFDEQDDDAAEESLTLADILQADNVATLLDEDELRRIGADVVRDFNIDIESRKRAGWDRRNEMAMKRAMQVQEAKDTPWPGAANIKYPLLTVASIQFQARAYPAIVDGTNLVKGRVLGPDNGIPAVNPQTGQPVVQMGPDGQPIPVFAAQPGDKRARADRIAQHMTWQLLYKMQDWEEDTDRMFLMLPILGCTIRKSYYDALMQSNVSIMVPPEDFVVNYWTRSLKTAPRFTHVLRYYPYEVRERVMSGIWLDVTGNPSYDDNKTSTDDESAPSRFYEQHRLIDLDGDGCPEPYVVITNDEGDVARISPCFGPEDIKVANVEEGGQKVQRVLRIDRNEYFTKYGFIPAPDGSFYDIGFGHLTGSINDTIDTILNQLIDAASLSNSQGGFIGSGVKPKSGNLRFRLGEWKVVDNIGGALRDNIMPLQLPGPSPVLFQLLGMLIEAAKDITSVQDIMTGGPSTAQTATTTMAQVEQGMKAFTAIFKRIHRAFGQELRILFRLNRDHLEDEEYFALSDNPQAVMRKDYEDKDLDVIPVSDPAMSSDMQKMARADYLNSFTGNPFVNQQEITRRRLEAGNVADIKAIMDVPAPGPDPKMLIDQMKNELEKMKIANDRLAKLADADAKRAVTSKTYADAAKILNDMGLVEDAAKLAAQSVEEVEEEERGEPANEQVGVSAMGGASGDGSVSGVLPGHAGPTDAGMGPGGVDASGAAGAGGNVGPVG